MTITTLDTRATAAPARPVLSRIFGALGAGKTLVAQILAGARAGQQAGWLAQLPDAQLADRGLRRDGIVDHAFRDLT